jgi:hypothetical protein
MNIDLLKKHVQNFAIRIKENSEQYQREILERKTQCDFYQSFTQDKIQEMSELEIYEYLSSLWAMLMWGNKHYVVDKIIEQNGVSQFRTALGDLVWGSDDIGKRWDSFRKKIKGMGPAMTSEILCKAHPEEFMIWNRRAAVGLSYLEAEQLPRYDYQVTGEAYKWLCSAAKQIAKEMKVAGIPDTSLLAVDYFIWSELSLEKSPIGKGPAPLDPSDLIFVHDEIRDKLRDIGEWLGFSAKTEQTVSAGAKVDTIWEATIGNMGRVIYVFEVQTKGSIDGLLINLLKSLKNPAVQGIVAVSDGAQLEKIKKHAHDLKELSSALKYWNYEEVLKTHERLQFVYETINKIGLVPEGF